MTVFLLAGFVVAAFCILALNKAPIWMWAAFALLVAFGLVTVLDGGLFLKILLFAPALALLALAVRKCGAGLSRDRYMMD